MKAFVYLKNVFTLIFILATVNTNAQNIFPSNGNVGIGTTSPSSLLEVKNNSLGLSTQLTGSILKFTRNNNFPSYIDKYDGGDLVFRFGSSYSNLFTLSPTNALQINTNVGSVMTFNNTNDSWQYMQFKSNGTRKAYMGMDNSNNFVLKKENGGTVRLIADQTNIFSQIFIKSDHDNILTLNNWDGQWSFIDYRQNDLRKAYVGLDANGDFRIFKEMGGKVLINAPLLQIYNKVQIGNNTITSGIHNTSNVKLTVDGHAIFKKVIVTQSNWADFVFDDDYRLKSLDEVEAYIEENNHLPDVPSEQEVIENGISLGDMDAILLQKIEELTLYLIKLENKNQELEKQIHTLLNNY